MRAVDETTRRAAMIAAGIAGVTALWMAAERWAGMPDGEAVETVLALALVVFTWRGFLGRILHEAREGISLSGLPLAMAVMLAVLSGPASVAGLPVPCLAGTGVLMAAAHLAGRYLRERNGAAPKHEVTTPSAPAAPLPHPAPEGDAVEAEQPITNAMPRLSAGDVAATIAGALVPGAAVLAGATAIIWSARPELLHRMVSPVLQYLPWGTEHPALLAPLAVLAAVSPAAVLLALPSALAAGMARARELEIRLRHPEVLDHLREVSIVALDKEGALTVGPPKVVHVEAAPGATPEEVLAVAAAVMSPHGARTAQAVAAHARYERVEFGEVEEPVWLPGLGAKGLVEETLVLAGKEALMRTEGVKLGTLEEVVSRLHREGRATVLVAKGTRLLGAIALADSLKKDSVRAVKVLKRMQVRAVMLTSDSAASARVVAEQMGIVEVQADVATHEKIKALAKLKKETIRRVAFASGPGEAEALAGADVLTAREDLMSIVTALQLARATQGVAMQNLFVALGYHAAVLPLAMLGFVHPAIAAALGAMLPLAVARGGASLKQFDVDKYSAEVLRR